MTGDRLYDFVRSVGRRFVAVGAGLGLTWGLVLAGAILGAAVWADLALDLTGPLRLGAVCIAAVAAAVFLIASSVRASVRANPLSIARRLDEAAGAGGRIACGLDLHLNSGGLGPLSAGMARMAVDEAASLAARTPVGRAVSARPLLTPVALVAAFAAVVVGFCSFAPRLAATQWARFADPFGDHPPYTPLMLHVEPGDAKVAYGASFDVEVRGTGAPVERMELVMRSEDGAEAVLPMFPESSERWRATLINVTEPGRYFVRSGRARSDRYGVQVVMAPQITGVRYRITQPAYANRSPYEGPLPKEGIAGLPRTRVDVWATSNRPLRDCKGTIVDASGRSHEVALAATSVGGNEVHGDFTIAESGKLQFHLVDETGEKSAESVTAPIQKLVDSRPFIRIVEPRESSFATPTASLPVMMAAEDDYGVARVQLFRSLNGSRALPMEIATPNPKPQRFEAGAFLPLSEYGLKAGDEIQLFGRVEDTNPDAPQSSESTVVTVRIIEQTEYEQLMQRQQGVEALQAKYQQAERRMEAMAEEIEQLEKKLAAAKDQNKPLTPAEQKELNKLAERLAEEAKAMEAAAKRQLPYDVDKQMSKEMQKLADALQKAAEEAKKIAASQGLPKKNGVDELKKLAKQLSQKRGEFNENAQKPIGDLAKAYALMEDEAKFLNLYRRQKDLAIRLASLRSGKSHDDPESRARMRDMEAEQRGLRDALQQLTDDIEAHAQQLPEDPQLQPLRDTALKFASDLRESGAAEAMASCESALAEFADERAAKSGKEAADILERFIARCSGQGSASAQCKNCLPKFQPKLGECMGNTLDQLLARSGLKQGGTGMGTGGQAGNAAGGMGGQDGYSMQQNTLRNVGLYGDLPTMQAASGRGGSRQAAGGPASRGRTRDERRNAAEVAANPEDGAATGGAQGAVPAQYRRRVSEYFQRIADEHADR